MEPPLENSRQTLCADEVSRVPYVSYTGGVMSKLELPSHGHCRCGEVQIRISAQPMLTMACHCKGCQRMSASAFSLSAAFPADKFLITQGEPVIGGIHGPAGHHF